MIGSRRPSLRAVALLRELILCCGYLLTIAALGQPVVAQSLTTPTTTETATIQANLQLGRRIENLSGLQQLNDQVQQVAAKVQAATVSLEVGHRQFQNHIAFGSGVVIDEAGIVLTAAHVAGSPDRPVVFKFADGRTARGVTLGLNEELDIGLMKIESPGTWPTLQMSSNTPEEGNWCLATGFPGGLDAGNHAPPLVRLGRVLKATEKILLTDCILVGGDSGGPLLDLNGDVIAIHSRIGSDLTTNLHVPVGLFRKHWDRMLDGQIWDLMRDTQPWIGVVHDNSDMRAKIRRVHRDSPAEQAGLQRGDLVLEVDGAAVETFAALRKFVEKQRPGHRFIVKYQRGDVAFESEMTIGKLDSPEQPQTRDDAELLREWLRTIDLRRSNGRAVVRIGKNADQVKDAFRDAVTLASRATVQIIAGGQRVALGTVIDRSGLILTKASLLPDSSSTLQCRVTGSRTFGAEIVARSRPHDLALLKAERQLRPIDLESAQVMLKPGAILASTSLTSYPIAIGVVSTFPRPVPSEGKLGIVMDRSSTQPRVAHVVNNSGALRAGLEIGDLVMQIDGQPIHTASQLISTVSSHYPGDTLTLTVDRQGKRMDLEAVLGRVTAFGSAMAEFEDFIGSDLSDRRTGFAKIVPHDTAILPEHCGGPVIDARGNFIGLNIARASRTSSYLLPADEVRRALTEMREQVSDAATLGVNTIRP